MEIKTMNMPIFIKITFEKHSYYRCLRIRNLIFKRVRIYYKKKLNVSTNFNRSPTEHPRSKS